MSEKVSEKMFSNGQLIHFGVEAVLLICVVFYFSSKNKKLANQIEELSARIEDQKDHIKELESSLNDLGIAIEKRVLPYIESQRSFQRQPLPQPQVQQVRQSQPQPQAHPQSQQQHHRHRYQQQPKRRDRRPREEKQPIPTPSQPSQQQPNNEDYTNVSDVESECDPAELDAELQDELDEIDEVERAQDLKKQ